MRLIKGTDKDYIKAIPLDKTVIDVIDYFFSLGDNPVIIIFFKKF